MGTLQVVATPIGNLEDVTLRALRVLREADLVLAEDTRHTRVLLDHHDVKQRPLSLNAHNEESRIRRVLEVLEGGGRVALVSDAGTPLVSDPGARLVSAALEAGHRVEPVPGASAVLAALTISGIAPEPFVFLGFLPRRTGARDRLLASYVGRPETLVLFESPRRVEATLAALTATLGPRSACVARELTKLHEEGVRGTLPELAVHFAEGARGECTIVVAGAGPEETATSIEIDVDHAIRERLAAGERPKEIAAALAGPTGSPRRELYARAVALREASDGDAG